MNGLTEQQLLRDYATRESEAAFAELARRHVDLVYSAALRMVRELVLDLTTGGARKLAQSTAGNIGRQLAIVWNDRVINAPRIRSVISGPSVNISGAFSDAEMQMLLDALNHR